MNDKLITMTLTRIEWVKIAEALVIASEGKTGDKTLMTLASNINFVLYWGCEDGQAERTGNIRSESVGICDTGITCFSQESDG